MTVELPQSVAVYLGEPLQGLGGLGPPGGWAGLPQDTWWVTGCIVFACTPAGRAAPKKGERPAGTDGALFRHGEGSGSHAPLCQGNRELTRRPCTWEPSDLGHLPVHSRDASSRNGPPEIRVPHQGGLMMGGGEERRRVGRVGGAQPRPPPARSSSSRPPQSGLAAGPRGSHLGRRWVAWRGGGGAGGGRQRQKL